MPFIFLAPAILACCATLSGTRKSLSGAVGTGEVFAIAGLEGRWAGPVTPADPACGAPTTGLMSITDQGFAFDPFGGTTIIRGTVAEGRLEGTLSRAAPGQQTTLDPAGKSSSAKHPLSIAFTGTARQPPGDAIAIDGALTSGHCRWAVTLRRA